MTQSLPVVLVAMAEEAQGFLDLVDSSSPLEGAEVAYLATAGGADFVLAVTGIGMTSAARAATLAAHGALGGIRPSAVVSAGTCGGMPGRVHVGDVVAVQTSLDWSADSTSIGYAYGQVPGQPAVHQSDAGLVKLAQGAGAVPGQVASANAFATRESVRVIAERFPEAVIVDMETAAIAQVCGTEGIPFVSLRCVSDMCQGDGGAEFDEHLDGASARSAQATLDLLKALAG